MGLSCHTNVRRVVKLHSVSAQNEMKPAARSSAVRGCAESECMPADPECTGCWKQAKELTRALDIESVLCLGDRTPLGRVEEVRSQNPDLIQF